MKPDEADRIAPFDKPARRPFIFAVAASAFALAAVIAVLPELQGGARVIGSKIGLVKSQRQEFFDTLKRLGITDISDDLLASDKITANLSLLTREKCDKTAIRGLADALVAAHEQRAAAYAYFGFAASCPNGEGEAHQAAQILLNLGDPGKVIAICDALIGEQPHIAQYRYLRGKALVAANRLQEALAAYRSAIDLVKEPRQIRDEVFFEMARVFAALGQGCDAAKTILVWVALDPAKRKTAMAQKLIREYASGNCRFAASPDDPKRL